ncbi:MAG TPA: hypothetical protein VGC42_14930, partial [Kofleriaceae bacterium]
ADLYQAAYQRAPTSDEQTFWSGQLVSGRSEATVASYIQLITDTFAEVYHRTPTFSELELYTQLLDDGVPL